MAKPYIHAESSARRFGGVAADYLDIHDLLDSSKGAFPDNRHRALTHNAWFLSTIIERVFGSHRVNSAGRTYSTRDVAEQHVLEDYGMRYIPSAQDFIERIEFATWMQNGKGDPPSSAARLPKPTTKHYPFPHHD
jgi:hypothetical protein